LVRSFLGKPTHWDIGAHIFLNLFHESCFPKKNIKVILITFFPQGITGSGIHESIQYLPLWQDGPVESELLSNAATQMTALRSISGHL